MLSLSSFLRLGLHTSQIGVMPRDEFALALPAASADPLAAAAGMVKFAVESGGIDNVTVVLIPFPLAAHGKDPADRTQTQADPAADAPTETLPQTPAVS